MPSSALGFGGNGEQAAAGEELAERLDGVAGAPEGDVERTSLGHGRGVSSTPESLSDGGVRAEWAGGLSVALLFASCRAGFGEVSERETRPGKDR